MPIKSLRPSPPLIIAFFLGALLFALDISREGLHLWARYLLPLFIVYFWGRPRELYPAGIYLSLLLVASFAAELPAGAVTPLDAFANHLLPLLVLWVVTWLSVQRRRSETALAAQVQARTAELAASEQHYRLLAENAIDVVWAVAMDGAMTYVSPSVLRLRGYTRAEMLAMTWDERLQTGFPPALLAAVHAGLAALRTGRPVAGGPFTFPSRHKHGAPLWLETELGPLYDDAGRPIGLRGVTRNVTARLEAEARVHAALQQLQLAAAAADVGIWHWNFVDASLEWDERMCQIMACPRAHAPRAATTTSGAPACTLTIATSPNPLCWPPPRPGPPGRFASASSSPAAPCAISSPHPWLTTTAGAPRAA